MTSPVSPPRGTSPVATAMAVLRCFTPERPELGVVEVAEAVGLHKSSISRMLSTLESEELVEQDAVTRKYRLGLGLLGITNALMARMDIRRIAQPLLTRLSVRTGETTSLMLWDGTAAVCIEQVPSPRPIKHVVEVGTRFTTVESSSTRIFVNEMTPDERATFLRLQHVTPSDYRSVCASDSDLGTVNVGVTVADEVGVSCGVRDDLGHIPWAILVSAPRYRVDDLVLVDLRTACHEAARELSTRLGGS